MQSVRPWIPVVAQARESEILASTVGRSLAELDATINSLIERNRQIHDVECVNLNPATNVMNPKAEAALSSGLGVRPSLGYPGEKYEMGLEAIEQVEVIAAELARRVFNARFAEVRVGSGALANLYAFMATCKPGDSIIAPPPSIGGHITHHNGGAAGLYGVTIHYAPVDASRYTIDVAALATLAREVRPKLITMGGSLNLMPHPVAEVKAIANEVGARVLFDAAHNCGMFAGQSWPNPLDLGADLMTMSTYKSLGGPPGGLLVTNDADLAERIDAIAYPGLTANFDASKTAALAISLLDWLGFDGTTDTDASAGYRYGRAMIETAQALAGGLKQRGVDVFETISGPTLSHQFAVRADQFASGDGHQAALRLRTANILTSAIGLPTDCGQGIRFGTPEIVRWGMGPSHMNELAGYIASALTNDPPTVASQVTAFRKRFTTLHHVRS
jgi:glycine hydroxymethyltransferase